MERNEINTVEMVRSIRDEQYDRSKDMKVDELLDYFHRGAEDANAQALRILEKSRTA